jgi:predicted ester cyclase
MMTETLVHLSEKEWQERLHAAVVRRFIEAALNRGNAAVGETHLAGNFVDHGGFLGEAAPRSGFADFLSGFKQAFPDGAYRIEDLLADGDKVVVRMTFTGTHQGRFRSYGATGRRVRVTGIHIFRCAGAHLLEHWAMESHHDLDAWLGGADEQTHGIW